MWYWTYFHNELRFGELRRILIVIDEVILYHDGLPHVITLVVPLLIFICPIIFHCQPESKSDLWCLAFTWYWDKGVTFCYGSMLHVYSYIRIFVILV